MKKLILILFLFTSFAFGETTFNDIETHWGKDWVTCLVEDNITTGYPDGTFRPNQTISVEEFTTFTVKALQNINDEKYKLKIEGEKWSDPFIDIAVNFELFDKNQFDDYTRTITREEMASIIIKAFNLENIPMQSSVNADIVESLYDYEVISPIYVDDMLKAIREGFISGKSTIGDRLIVDPKGTATRAEAAVVLVKLLESDKRIEMVIDRPSTTFLTTRYNGNIKTKVPVTYYAAKNSEGKYVTEVFDLLHHFEGLDQNKYDANYSPISEYITIDFLADDKYEEYYTGEFWNIARRDVMFKYAFTNYYYDETPYMLSIETKDFIEGDYKCPVSYLEEKFGSELQFVINSIFEDNAEEVIELLYTSFENNTLYTEYYFSNRRVTVAGGPNKLVMWFDEKGDM